MKLTQNQVEKMLVQSREMIMIQRIQEPQSKCQVANNLIETQLEMRHQMLEMLEQQMKTLHPQELQRSQIEPLER